MLRRLAGVCASPQAFAAASCAITSQSCIKAVLARSVCRKAAPSWPGGAR
jgi:hypothetical protein